MNMNINIYWRAAEYRTHIKRLPDHHSHDGSCCATCFNFSRIQVSAVITTQAHRWLLGPRLQYKSSKGHNENVAAQSNCRVCARNEDIGVSPLLLSIGCRKCCRKHRKFLIKVGLARQLCKQIVTNRCIASSVTSVNGLLHFRDSNFSTLN